MSLCLFLFSALFVVGTSIASADPFFFWMVSEARGGGAREGELEQKVSPDHKFVVPYVAEDSDWLCRISPPHGFRGSAAGFSSPEFQEGVTITCRLKSNPDIGVTEYGACQKHKDQPTENSGASLDLRSTEGYWVISAQCSDQSWKKQGKKAIP